MTNGTLLVVGAGAKAAAIAAKASALQAAGFETPRIVVLERSEIAANWVGHSGYTDGSMPLGTPPEKDVGFPYATDFFGEKAIAYMLSRYSWHAFQIFEGGSYGDWVDRGRSHPFHSDWGRYFKWVLERSNCEIFYGELNSLSIDSEGKWHVVYGSNSGPETDECVADWVVITGPGPPKSLPRPTNPHPKILDGKSFWKNVDKIDQCVEDDEPITVVGSGETSAAVLVRTLEIIGRRKIGVVLVNRHGTVFSRGEGYFENKMFSQPDLWHGLSNEARKEIIKRGDRGVISPDAHSAIASSKNVVHWSADIEGVLVQGTGSAQDIVWAQGTQGELIPSQLLIVATGFDQWWFSEYLPQNVKQALRNDDTRRHIEHEMQQDLSIPTEYVGGKIFVPALAGMAQGPGFTNLSCLGHLSDHIMRSVIP